jgi:diguanylate cyclase (GGDEF)-like protein
MFRYGGEEFLICLPNTRVEDAGILLNRLREQLAGAPVALVDHTEIRISASFGVAALDPEDEIALAIEHADHALLCAKSKGRNRVCIWNMAGEPMTLPTARA